MSGFIQLELCNTPTQILPDFQSSGTLKLTFEFAGATHLIILIVSDDHYLENRVCLPGRLVGFSGANIQVGEELRVETSR